MAFSNAMAGSWKSRARRVLARPLPFVSRLGLLSEELPKLCLRILVGDDEPLLCETISKHFAQDWHKVETSGNGREAFEKFKGGDFDLVITDQAMPEMNGD
jgi:PleD family two-component response regulator